MTDQIPDRLAEIKARADAATPGPWFPRDRGVGWNIAITEERDEYDRPLRLLPEGMRTDIGRREDAEFIAASRVDVDWLVAEVERLRARRQDEIDALKEKCGKQAAMLAKHCQRRDEVLVILDRFNTVPADDVIAETLIDSARNLLGGAR